MKNNFEGDYALNFYLKFDLIFLERNNSFLFFYASCMPTFLSKAPTGADLRTEYLNASSPS